MTDEAVQQPLPEPNEIQEPSSSPQLVTTQGDWLLEAFINMVNHKPAMEMGMTLQVSGFLVSGLLVSGKLYFEGIGAELDSAAPGGNLKEVFSGVGDMHYSTAENETHIAVPPSFVHLKNARFYHTSGQPMPSNRSVWWRGRVSEVAAFTIGTFSPQ